MPLISIVKIELNRGQIHGLPKKPRLIRDERFKKLKKFMFEFENNLGINAYRFGDRLFSWLVYGI